MDRNVIYRALLRATGILGVAALTMLSGCTNPPPAPEPAPPPPPPAPAQPPPAPKPKIDIDRLDALLERGDQALKAGRLLTPIDDCAYDYYKEALKVAPDHPAALHGLERIAERYVAMAEQAAEKGQYQSARTSLERARIVDPDLDSIDAMEAQIKMRSTAQRQTSALDAQQLSDHSAALVGRLKALGAQAKAQDSWVVIRARNDAEGRWIYQQMADSPGSRRIRAELTLGAPPAVDLLQLKPADPTPDTTEDAPQ
jgi:tetratricopeptide (TPR) repeat protein